MATIWADPTRCLICRVHYSIRNRNVTMTGRNITDIDVSTSAAAWQTSGLASWQVAGGNELLPTSPGIADARNSPGTSYGIRLGLGHDPFQGLLRATNPAFSDSSILYDADAPSTTSRLPRDSMHRWPRSISYHQRTTPTCMSAMMT